MYLLTKLLTVQYSTVVTVSIACMRRSISGAGVTLLFPYLLACCVACMLRCQCCDFVQHSYSSRHLLTFNSMHQVQQPLLSHYIECDVSGELQTSSTALLPAAASSSLSTCYMLTQCFRLPASAGTTLGAKTQPGTAGSCCQRSLELLCSAAAHSILPAAAGV
jgi:hypothetical protein